MNDADCRRSPDGFDDDAIFADIVAHLNDEATEAGPAEALSAEDAAAQSAHRAMADQSTQEADPTQPTDDADPTQPADPADPTWPTDLNDPTDPTDPIWPTDLTRPDDEPEPTDSVERAPGAPAPIDPTEDSAAQVWRAHQVDDEVEEHFEPPPVTPLPAGDLQFWAIIAGMTGGPLLLLYLVFFKRDTSSLWILLAIGMSVGGFALLVSRMPDQDDDDDGARL